MGISKTQRSNIIYIVLIGVLFFTPIGGKIKEYATRLLAFAPSIENEEYRIHLSNYNWSLKGVNESDINFLEAEGKVVLVNFWATWCPPCRAEIPSIQKLYNDYKDEVIFLFVTNEDREAGVSFLDANNYDLPVYNEMGQRPSEFSVTSIPATYIVDKQGAIVVDKVGAANWNSEKVRSLLDELLRE